MVKKALKTCIKPVVFLIGLVLLIIMLQSVFSVADYRIYQTVHGFYEEDENSLDAVYVGASNVYAFWQAPLAWEEYGYAVYSMSIPNMPPSSTKYIIEECRKTQPDALYIVNLNGFKNKALTEAEIHYVADYMPFSSTKVKMVNQLTEEFGISAWDRLEYYLPLIRFHSGWSELETEAFYRPLATKKAGSEYKSFLSIENDVSDIFTQTDSRLELTETMNSTLEDLFSYVENNDVKILFVAAPQAFKDESDLAQINTMVDIAKARGFDVLDLLSGADELGLDLTTDYYNKNHMNIHGSLKFTHYVGKYLGENYGFEDKRGNPEYADWDAAGEEYNQTISPYTLDFEQEHLRRDYSLDAPKLTKVKASGKKATLTWENNTVGADAYLIYRKHTQGDTVTAWQQVATVDSDTATYIDDGLQLYTQYTYTVVPVRYQNDKTYYGKYDMNGISAKSILSAPTLKSMTETEKGITITWEPKKGADGYILLRKINGQEWSLQKDVGKALSYTDEHYQSDLPYVYTVRAYENVSGEKVNGHYSAGLLRLAQIEAPTAEAELTEEKTPLIKWNQIKGVNYYTVYKMNDSGEWDKIADNLTALSYVDTTHAEGNSATYKVAAVIKHREEIYEFPSDNIVLKEGA